ncbi:MAG: hypothetical protein FVQ80_10920 [Planctomycetes bacterium]|nr:hypothetical protein [Planctomycetota bacterium]
MDTSVPKVVVIGGTYIDIAVRCTEIPSAGESVVGTALSYSVSGPGPNQAAQAALCRCDVHLVSKVGGDPFNPFVKENLAEFDVNSDFVFLAEPRNTGTTITLVNSIGDNASCMICGANNALNIADIESAENIISEADICLIHGRLPQASIIKAIRLAEIHGTKVILNPARPLEQSGSEPCELPAEYFGADILIPNLYEAADITERSSANINTAKLIGSDLIARGVGCAIITIGRRGCMVVDRNGADHIPAFDIELVDQTCTGDSFAGALAAYCAVKKNIDIREAARFACAAGALVCTKFGSLEALPTKAEIIELLQKND